MSLPYHRDVMRQLIADDGLWILAKGIGLEELFFSLIKVYCHPQTLVFVLNDVANFDSTAVMKMRESGVTHLPKVITNEINSQERQSIYATGGVFFVTSRILVVDLLNQRVPAVKIHGMIVLNAHSVTETSTEAFILRLYRQHNKTGFIKALSERADSFASGYMKMENMMKVLFLKKVYLWPRFHLSVCESLEQNEPEVVEVELSLTPSMLQIQNLVIEMMDSCLAELRKSKKVDLKETTVKNSLFKSFDSIIRGQLDPIWHTLSMKVKTLVSDIKTLRKLLTYVIRYDCVTFLGFLESLRVIEGTSGTSQWFFLDQTPRIFHIARSRVYSKHADRDEVEEVLEENPKWESVSSILEEILEYTGQGSPVPHTLIVVKDERTHQQLHGYLTEGGDVYLRRKFQAFRQRKDVSMAAGSGSEVIFPEQPTSPPSKAPAKSARGGAEKASSSRGKMQTKKAASREMLQKTLVPYMKPSRPEEKPQTKPSSSATVIKLEDHEDEGHSPTVVDLNEAMGSSERNMVKELPNNVHIVLNAELEESLRAFTPTFVIFYDADLRSVRILEVFKALRPGHSLRIYFLTYEKSVEQQKYISSVQKEKDSFDTLIRRKATMMVDHEQDGKVAQEILDHVPYDPSSRYASKDSKPTSPQVVVDIREFRSALPSLLQSRGIKIVPVTLEVGDYILSPEICVERKSVSDLYGSFASGRLYTQAEAMTRLYKTPVLLIEFDQAKSFSLQAMSEIDLDISPNSINSKLSLLILHFPTLKIVWSRSPYNTAELFERLKRSQEEPDATKAIAVGMESATTEEFNLTPQEILKKIPGVTQQNIHAIMNRVENLYELSKMSRRDLDALVGPRSAAVIFQFFATEVDPNV
eukprot:TRINITY_DN5790_c0_g1_i9.p1 TRINITY_DN5790_c0_g1~~TRINITY_DN5790_c0_g1_i9.p1  ORF type:complete len:868 (-),score=195.83 TRINITY_DN5790_c0_g1_i9:150-2753(-)